jgi:hypothetical protein
MAGILKILPPRKFEKSRMTTAENYRNFEKVEN